MTDARAATIAGPPDPEEVKDRTLADSYAFLMKVVGVIALILPPVVALGDWWIDDVPLRGSISAYYYGRTGGFFVGSLCAMAVFFLSYQRKTQADYDGDKLMSDLAFVAAAGVALFPTAEAGRDAEGSELVISTIHVVAAGLLFVLLAVFSLYQFTKTKPEIKHVKGFWPKFMRIFRTDPAHQGALSEKKRLRNLIYRICGWIIVACIVLILINNIADWDALFWLESIAVWAFAASWIVKSEWIPFLND